MPEKTLSKEEWGRVEKALSGCYGIVKMKVDGRSVTFRRALVDKNRLAIVTYVDGYMRGEWIDAKKEHPEQRYLRPASRYIHKPKQREELKKIRKRTRKAMGEFFDPDAKWHYFDPSWPSVTAIRRHYQKTFQAIELLEVIGA